MADAAQPPRQAPRADPSRAPTESGTAGCRPHADAPGRGLHRKAMLEPAVLLSLLAEDVHGYELIEQVQSLVGEEVCVDPGSTYRLLRAMEGEGLVVSSWIITDQGPNRRAYTITAAGRAALSHSIAELRRRARTLEALACEAEERLARHGYDHQPAEGGLERKGAT